MLNHVVRSSQIDCVIVYCNVKQLYNIWIILAMLKINQLEITETDGYHTSWMVVVTQTDRSKSVCNRSVIEVCDGVFVLSIAFLI